MPNNSKSDTYFKTTKWFLNDFKHIMQHHQNLTIY